MSSTGATVRACEAPVVRAQPFMSRAGESCVWLIVGEDGELQLYGSSRVMRRVGEAVLAAADVADALCAADSVEGVVGS